MSLFLSYPVNLQAAVTVSAWHPTQKLLAVGALTGEVLIFNEEGEKIDKFVLKRTEKSPVLCLAWHPSKVILAAGFQDGGLSVYTDSDKKFTDAPTRHPAAVSMLTWSPEGRRIVSGDESGTVSVWRVDSRGAFQPATKYAVKGKVSFCCFRTTSNGATAASLSASRASGQSLNIECPPFFFGGDSGVVYIADDSGHHNQAFTMQFPLAALLFMESRQALVAITKNAVMSIHRLATAPQQDKSKPPQQDIASISLTQVARVKISASASDGVSAATWVGPGVLAYVANESMIRLWDIHHEENYTLKAFGASSSGGTQPSLTCLSYNARRRVVAAGSSDGRIVLFEFRGNEKAPRGSDDWHLVEELTFKNANGPVRSLSWGPGTHLLSAQTTKGVSVFFETRFQRCINAAGICAVQISSSLVHVSNGSVSGNRTDVSASFVGASVNKSLASQASSAGAASVEFVIDCGEGTANALRIKGMSMSSKYVAVFDSRRVAVYSLETQKRVALLDPSSIAQAADLATISAIAKHEASQQFFSACALHPFEDYVFLVRENALEMRSFEGSLVSSILFSPEIEGVPVHLATSFGGSPICNFNRTATAFAMDTGRSGFLAVVTDRSWAKVYSLAGREPRQVGIPRLLCPDDPESLRAVSINSTGNKIGFLRNNASILLEQDMLELHYNLPRDVKESARPMEASKVRSSMKMIPVSQSMSKDQSSKSLSSVSASISVTLPGVQLSGSDVSDAAAVLSVLRAGMASLFVYDLEEDKIFIKCFEDTKALEAAAAAKVQPKEGAAPTEEASSPDVAMLPVDFLCWDPNEARTLACQIAVDGSNSDNAPNTQRSEAGTIHVCFVTSEHGLVVQDSILAPAGASSTSNAQAFVGICVPFVFTSSTHGRQIADRPLPSSATNARPIVREYLRDFVGLENLDLFTDQELRRALLDFSFFLAVGSMDDAFKAVRKVFSSSTANAQTVGQTLWRNMAKMAVQTRKVDVAEMCIRRMGIPRTVQLDGLMSNAEFSVTDVPASDGSPEDVAKEKAAKLGAIAIDLGMFETAERIYREADRYDLLVRLHVLVGRWDEAIAVARERDRIHLKTVQYQYARDLESQGQVERAIKLFESAQMQATEVPRMLYGLGRMDDLRIYVDMYKNDRTSPEDAQARLGLMKWWAGYHESLGDFEQALPYYQLAGDLVSAVRVMCFLGRYDDAEKLSYSGHADAVKTASPIHGAAAYLLARHLEEVAAEDMSAGGDSLRQRAIRAYAAAGQYRQALRVACAAGLDGELMGLAMQGDKTTKREAAEYFEQQGQVDRAVQLYHKSGMLARAVEMCIERHLYEVLDTIIQELLEATRAKSAPEGDASAQPTTTTGVSDADAVDPSLWIRCAEFFASHSKYERASELYAAGGQFEKALDVLRVRNVRLSDDVAEAMTARLDALQDAQRRSLVLSQMAQLAMQQGNFHLATKKFTQAGDRVRAMQALVQSGDVEKIVFFANVSKQRELYMLAANHLQNMDWRNDASIMKHIVSLYSKAKAPDALASFYEACAQIEIDDYRDYDRALAALREAEKYLSKARVNSKERRAEDLQQRTQRVEKFVAARSAIAGGDADTMVRMCYDLIDEMRALETSGGAAAMQSVAALRLGDVFALLVEYFVSVSQTDKARDLLQQMRQLRIKLDYFLGPEMVEFLTQDGGRRAVDNSGGRSRGGQQARRMDDDEEPVDEIDDEESVTAQRHPQQPRSNVRRYADDDDDVVQEDQIIDEEVDDGDNWS